MAASVWLPSDSVSDSTVTGIVLAAGLGTRMGATKQLVDIGGSPMVALTVGNALASRLGRVIVVVGHDADAVRSVVPEGAEIVENPDYERGNLSSYRVGVAAAGNGPVMVTLVDMPGVTPTIIDTCLERFEIEGTWAVMARYSDAPGHPYVLSARAVARSADYEGRKALHRMLGEQTAGRVVEVVFDQRRPIDVNTPEDVALYLKDRR